MILTFIKSECYWHHGISLFGSKTNLFFQLYSVGYWVASDIFSFFAIINNTIMNYFEDKSFYTSLILWKQFLKAVFLDKIYVSFGKI